MKLRETEKEENQDCGQAVAGLEGFKYGIGSYRFVCFSIGEG